jgi:hypothetical protein
LQQQSHRLIQLQSASGGVGEEESVLRNKASSLEFSVAPKWRAVRHISAKKDRHRGSDEGDAPLLLEFDGAAEDKPSEGLGEAKAVETWPALC